MSEEQEQIGTAGTDCVEGMEAGLGFNRDAMGLGIMTLSDGDIGILDPIDEEDDIDIPGFVPTIHELKALASHWMRLRIDLDFDWFVYEATSSSDWQWSVLVFHRLNRLAAILGEQAMQEAWDGAVAYYRHLRPEIDNEDWRVFTAGSRSADERHGWRTKLRKDTFPEADQERR